MGGPDVEGQEEEQAQETEKKSELERAQDQYGNAALASMLGNAAAAAGGGDGGGGPSLATRDSEEEVEGPAHGGDDDPVDDGTLTMEDLTRSWNPRIKREKDRPAFTESMPDDDLPPDDRDWLAAVRAAPRPQLPPASTPDGLLQPTSDAVRAGLTPWIQEAIRWAGPDLATRALGHALAPSAPCLQDPWGRVLLARARAGAAASWMILDSPTLASRPDGPSWLQTAVLQLCLEIAGSGRRRSEVEHWAREHAGDLPLARDVLAAQLPDGDRPERWRQVPTRRLPEAMHQRLLSAFGHLADLTSARAIVPSLAPLPSTSDDDDPLGLDALLIEHTGGAPDPQEGLFHAGIQAAERLAAATARARVRMAGVAAALGDACRHWSAGTPTAALLDAMTPLDQEARRILQLLVEVARAAQRRAVPPKGIRNGLTHAAKGLDQAVQASLERLAEVAGGVLPPPPARPADDPLPPAPPDRLDLALEEGDLDRALSWVRSQPPTPSTQAAVVGLQMVGGASPEHLIDPLRDAARRARAAEREALAMVLETCLGPCLLWTGQVEEALALSASHLQAGRARRNGMVIACAALLGMEAHRLTDNPDALAALRLEAGSLCWHMGARGGLALLARWSPPDDELD